MNKKEVSEIKRLFTKERCAINRICGCYIDTEKEKRLELKEAFLSLPEEEMFKYFDIFRKTLSGTIGKNLLNMPFPLEQEMGDGTQKFLLKLRDSELKDQELLDEFYDKIIETYYHPENYFIILIHGSYDIPQRTSDGLEMDDASDYIYNFILCSICPVNLSKAGLCYNAETNNIEDRIRDWIVEMPELGFLFPAFNDRNSDVHSLLYYSKNSKEFNSEIVEQILGCTEPLPADAQKESFDSIIEDTFGTDCTLETIRMVHDNLNEMIEEAADSPDPVILDKADVKTLLYHSGATEENLEHFEEQYDTFVGEKATVMASNITNTRKFEIKTPDITVNVNPDRTDLVDTRVINGKRCLVIEINDQVEVNGIHVFPEDDSENLDIPF
ncbi:Uncharacterised protein [uncultured Roseburia sp.]|uniref:DUF4317 domain-containing protein n=1 Tax=Brotonthovivens ammoniilytica TaxID=2981725 RepID=A0ABT2TKT6_9FIRM|nr:DUF4317 domain-containing protein [Brotonthovivens ammoniilytica]MCU6762823.1 DUF4317 domain-containing protein [Brotonthovivens ammoniilytica]SCI90230.1 Uncharacterised protein [uncultured Roseburia sp.]